ncbi:crAss001_48 related protein [Moraxella catarrhalis]|uniref:crAss001_48 related protein n=1 Tax=Moraxella catarrhalis TaxID=480 RepID=UPI00080389CC|nr:hypothetical protein [Moraxella catarrhalis]MPW63667.1 hypothetical protein [Moraxella catarrhalis]OBX44659.1 hypothetical protein A9Z57_01415 [Moraxella catarrhalis]RKM04760.1 hypothetical protein D6D72_00850 [Moraxella catarrhalis]
MPKNRHRQLLELYGEITKLGAILDCPKPKDIHPHEWILMKDQIYYMRQYYRVLKQRTDDTEN